MAQVPLHSQNQDRQNSIWGIHSNLNDVSGALRNDHGTSLWYVTGTWLLKFYTPTLVVGDIKTILPYVKKIFTN